MALGSAKAAVPEAAEAAVARRVETVAQGAAVVAATAAAAAAEVATAEQVGAADLAALSAAREVETSKAAVAAVAAVVAVAVVAAEVERVVPAAAEGESIGACSSTPNRHCGRPASNPWCRARDQGSHTSRSTRSTCRHLQTRAECTRLSGPLSPRLASPGERAFTRRVAYAWRRNACRFNRILSDLP